MKTIFKIYLIVLCFGCGQGYKVTELYRQTIPNSDKQIFIYEAQSNLNDGMKFGYAILDKNEKESISQVEQKPFRIFSSLPKKDTVCVIGQLESEQRVPTFSNTTIENYKGLIIKTDNYKYLGSPWNLEYCFSSFTETSDNIIIQGLTKLNFDLPTNKTELTIRKSNIKLVESENGKLKELETYIFLLDKFQSGSINNQTILKDTSFKFEGLVLLKLIPSKTISIKEFSDIGFYKKQKIKNPDFIE